MKDELFYFWPRSAVWDYIEERSLELRDSSGLVKIPEKDWPLFKKCAKNRGYPDVKSTEHTVCGSKIFMSGAPLHIAQDILSGIESGEISTSLLRTAWQKMWVGANQKYAWTVCCPKWGKICSIHNVCPEQKKTKGTRGYRVIKSECQYFVEFVVDGIVCLHPKAEEFELRSPWKEEQTTEGLPLFEKEISEKSQTPH